MRDASIELISRRLFDAALAYQVTHPATVMRFYPNTRGVPDWVEVDARIALYELSDGRILRARVTAEHAEGATTAYHAAGAIAHVNTAGWWMLTDVDRANPVELRRVWLQSLKRRGPRFEPNLNRATVHPTVAAALENLQ